MFFGVIKNNKAGIAALLVVCCIAFLFVGFVFHILRENGEDMDRMKVFGNKHAYVTTDATPDIEVQRILSQKNASELLSGFFSSLYADEISFCVDYGYDMYCDDKGNIVRYHTATESFFALYGLTAGEGRLFSKDEYMTTGDVTPVVIGYDLRESFKLGQEYYFDNPTGGGGFQGLIIGVLNKNSEYFRMNNISVNENLDSSYIVPFGPGMCTPDRAVSDYDMALSSLVLFLDNPQTEELINKRIQDMNLFQYSLVDVDDAADEALDERQKTILAVSMLSLTIAVVVLATAYLVFRRIIRVHEKEIGVRVLCGASLRRITAEIARIAGVLIAVAMLPAIVLAETWREALACIGCAGILFLLILCIPVHLIRKLSVVEIIGTRSAE